MLADAGTEVERSSAGSVISVQNLVHRYEDRTALNGVSFEFSETERADFLQDALEFWRRREAQGSIRIQEGGATISRAAAGPRLVRKAVSR